METNSLGAQTLQKYPQEKCVMNREKHTRFVGKCQDHNLARSKAMNLLVDLWLDGKVELPIYERTASSG